MDKAFQEEVVCVIIRDSFRHFLKEIPWLSRSHGLQINRPATLLAMSSLWLEQISIIRTKSQFLRFSCSWCWSLRHLFFNLFLKEKKQRELVKKMRKGRTRLKGSLDLERPTNEEVDLHNLCQLPYRNWCPLCVKAKGKELNHRRSIDEPRGLSEYSFDHCFPGDEFGSKLG